MTYVFKKSYLLDSVVVGGKLESEGPLGKYLDSCIDIIKDSFENNEIEMLFKSIDMLKEKLKLEDKDIDLAISGELSNQLTTTSYTYRRLLIPLIGIYSACSTISLGIGVASMLIDSGFVNKILVSTSSNNQNAERQFRNPIEYGGEKEDTQTFTSSIAAACIITSQKNKIKISSFTLGKVIDIGFTDSCDFGRAMAPAAIETLLEHFKNTNTNPSDYDLVLTGDLSYYGHKLVKKVLSEKYSYTKNYYDCGMLLFDINKQNVFAGGSGPGTSAGVLLSFVKKQMLKNKFKKVLLCATGALMNPTMINQKNSIPCIAHIIVLENVK